MAHISKSSYKVPKYVHLAEQLRQKIESGELAPGDQLPSLAHMKAEFGISQATWEKVNSSLEEEGLVVRKPGQGTFITRSHRSQLTGNIGFTGVAFRQANRVPHPSHLLSGIQSVAERENVHVLLLSSAPDREWAKVDGLFLCDPDAATVLRRAPETMPCVSLLLSLPGVSSVVADDYEGSRLATAHLLQLGHRRIAYLQTDARPLVQPRLQGYRAALREFGIEPKTAWVKELTDLPEDLGHRERGSQRMAQWLSGDWQQSGCTALLAQNDEVAIGAIEALRKARIDVPEQVSVVGFDGTELCEYCSPRLTTVQVPLSEIGAVAARVLLDQINDGTSTLRSIILPTTLKAGESTAPPPRS